MAVTRLSRMRGPHSCRKSKYWRLRNHFTLDLLKKNLLPWQLMEMIEKTLHGRNYTRFIFWMRDVALKLERNYEIMGLLGMCIFSKLTCPVTNVSLHDWYSHAMQMCNSKRAKNACRHCAHKLWRCWSLNEMQQFLQAQKCEINKLMITYQNFIKRDNFW